MIFTTFLTVVLVATSASELAHPEDCVANATNSDDSVAKGSPLMQKVVTKSINTLEEKRRSIQFEGFAIDNQVNRGQWESNWDIEVSSLTLIDPIRPNDQMLNDSLNDGIIDRRYKSWYMPGGPDPDIKEKKFYHEVGVTMAHRRAWQGLIDRAQGDGNHWGLIFEGDAIMRADFWRWMRHLKDEVIGKGVQPFMIWLGHCWEVCYSKQSPQFRDGDFCFDGNEENNPHNVSGCMLHFTSAICPTAYLINIEAAHQMLEVTTPMNCALDEKFRYEIQRNNWDARIMCGPLVRQPWQWQLVQRFGHHATLEEKTKQQGYLQFLGESQGRLVGEVHDANICGPPGDWVRTIEHWP